MWQPSSVVVVSLLYHTDNLLREHYRDPKLLVVAYAERNRNKQNMVRTARPNQKEK
jgi:hypothetical protein